MTKKRLGAIVLIILFISIGGLCAFVFLQGDVWKEIALNSINENISTEMRAGDVDISFLSTFPSVSVVINDVVIKGLPPRAGVEGDDLLNVEKLGVAFSLWEVVFGTPVIRSIYIENGELRVEEFANKWNFEITQDSNGSEEFEVSQIHLSHIDFTYISKGEVKSTGILNKVIIVDQTIGLSFEDLKHNSINDVFVPLYGELSARYERTETEGYSAIIKGVLGGIGLETELIWEGDGLDLIGHFSNVEKSDLQRVFLNKEPFEGWSYGGVTKLFFHSDRSSARIDFSLPEADFAVSPDLTGLSLNNKGVVSGKGRVNIDYDRDELGFTLDGFSINSNGLNLNLDGVAEVWDKRPLELDVNGTLDLGSSYLSWVPDVSSNTQSIMPVEGNISFSSLLSIPPSGDVKFSTVQIESSSIKGSLNSSPYSISNLMCDYSRGLFNLKGASFNWAGNVGEINSRITSFEEALDGGQIQGSVQITAESIVVDPILEWWGNRSNSSDTDAPLTILPLGSSLAYTIGSDLLMWDDLECSNTSSKGEITSKKLRISFAKANLLSGEATIQGQLKTASEKIVLGIMGSAEGFSYSDLFRVYENFGQDVLRAEHMQGRGDIAGSMNLVWDKEGNWESNSFDAELQASISNGRLKGLEVFDDVADYLKENRLIAPLVDPEDLRKRLSYIEFDFVETPVTVKLSTASIPFTSIQSSAMNVSLEGSQTFEGGIDYTLGFALRDLRDNKQGEFGDIQDDGLGNMFFLGMDGTLDEPVYSYDRQAAKANRRRAISNEAQRIKDAFSKDPDSSEEPKPQNTPSSSWRENSDVLDDPDDDDF
ncbi:MAG: hypothetical protein CMB32_07170 [Euryarchaeota archaeon]|nr:hypothetical protein [Euryarchaeota archaeon]|tara:strand:- start:5741 stop:8209 length:2469 start_codon:yes stop_codon:yes gene_type:complete